MPDGLDLLVIEKGDPSSLGTYTLWKVKELNSCFQLLDCDGIFFSHLFSDWSNKEDIIHSIHNLFPLFVQGCNKL